MPSTAVRLIQERLATKSSEELLSIWVGNDHTRWSDDAFEAAAILLKERGEPVPEQQPRVDHPRTPWGVHLAGFGGRVLLVLASLVAAGALLAAALPQESVGRRAAAVGIGLAVAAACVWGGLAGVRFAHRNDAPKRERRFVLWTLVTVGAAAGAAAGGVARTPDSLELWCTFLAVIVPIACLFAFRTPGRLLVFAGLSAAALSLVGYPAWRMAEAQGRAARRERDVAGLPESLTRQLTPDAFRAAVRSPLEYAGPVSDPARVLVCSARPGGGAYALRPDMIESYLPSGWAPSPVGTAELAVVVHPAVEVLGPFRPVPELRSPVLVFRLPAGNLVGSGSIDRRRAPQEGEVDGWNAHRERRETAVRLTEVLAPPP